MKKITLLLALAIFLGGCLMRPTHNMKVPFSADQAAFIHKKGTAVIKGQLFARTRGGDVKKGAGSTVSLIPVTAYSTERFSQLYQNGNYSPIYEGAIIKGTDPQYRTYIRQTTADGDGNFQFDNVASGTYYVQGNVTWSVPGHSLPTGGGIYETVSVQNGDSKKVILTPKL